MFVFAFFKKMQITRPCSSKLANQAPDDEANKDPQVGTFHADAILLLTPSSTVPKGNPVFFTKMGESLEEGHPPPF